MYHSLESRTTQWVVAAHGAALMWLSSFEALFANSRTTYKHININKDGCLCLTTLKEEESFVHTYIRIVICMYVGHEWCQANVELMYIHTYTANLAAEEGNKNLSKAKQKWNNTLLPKSTQKPPQQAVEWTQSEVTRTLECMYIRTYICMHKCRGLYRNLNFKLTVSWESRRLRQRAGVDALLSWQRICSLAA